MGVKGQHTGMAGEFAVMERLHRLGHEPALTLGNAKTVDIMSKSPNGKLFQISVTAIQGGGKWGIGAMDYSSEVDLIFVMMLYRRFDDLQSQPEVWVMPVQAVMQLRKPWLKGGFAIYCGNAEQREKIEQYRNRWDLLDVDSRTSEFSKSAAPASTPAVASFGGPSRGVWRP